MLYQYQICADVHPGWPAQIGHDEPGVAITALGLQEDVRMERPGSGLASEETSIGGKSLLGQSVVGARGTHKQVLVYYLHLMDVTIDCRLPGCTGYIVGPEECCGHSAQAFHRPSINIRRRQLVIRPVSLLALRTRRPRLRRLSDLLSHEQFISSKFSS
jgi:hypothetical protein